MSIREYARSQLIDYTIIIYLAVFHIYKVNAPKKIS